MMFTRTAKQLLLHLTDLQRSMLDYLAERFPSKTEEMLVDGVFSRGLAVVVGEEREREGRVVEGQGKPAPRVAFVSAGGVRPFPKNTYEEPRPVPASVNLQLGEELRQRLEAFLASHQGTNVHTAIETLLGVGFGKLDEDPGALDPARLFEELKSETTSAKTAARKRRAIRLAKINAVARGH